MISYDRIAERYNQTRQIPSDSLDKIIKSLNEEIPNMHEKDVIDLGVGTGRFAIPLSKYVKSIVGIDISKKMIEILDKNNNADNLSAICGRVEKLPFQNCSFDIAFAVSIFHLVSKWQDVINEIERVIKPAGYCIIGYTEYVGEQGKQFEYIRYELLRKHIESAKAKGLSFLEQKKYFDNRWDLLEDVVGAEWDEWYTPNDILNGIESNFWSETWNITPLELRKVIKKMKRNIVERGIDLKKTYQVKIKFVFSIYSVS